MELKLNTNIQNQQNMTVLIVPFMELKPGAKRAKI